MKLTDVELGGGVAYKYVCYACLLCFCVGAVGGGWWGYNNAKVVTVDRHTVEKPVVVQGQHTASTQIQYVEKEVVNGKTEPTDVQVNVNKSVVTVMVNGKPYQFELLQGETQKFDKGKIVLDQTSKLNFDVQVPTIDLTRHNSAGLWYTNHGAAVSLGRYIKPNIEIKAMAGQSIYGGGIEVRF